MDIALPTVFCLLAFLGALSSGAMASRRHNQHHRHHHHQRLPFSTSTNKLVYCQEDDECRPTGDGLKGGETCHWLYQGCSVGVCMCDPLLEKQHPQTGRCIPARYGGDSCNMSTSGTCPAGMFCTVGGVCQCRVGQMTPDRLFCLRYHQKLVGDTCQPRVDTCYQRAVYGYTSSEVRCQGRRCECNGERQRGITCSTWKLYERGCTKLHHCDGGAICVDRQCVCPTGYVGVVSGDHTKCVKRNAVRDLPLGAECDEINELRYCAQGLVCHRCSPHDLVFRCVRFRQTAMMELPLYGSSSTSSVPSPLFVGWLLSIVSCFLAFYQRTCDQTCSSVLT